MNQLYINLKEDSFGLNKDLLAIRMASVNPILDPWIYILLRKTVVLKMMEKIKCLFCKMGGRAQRGGRQFRCVDGHLSSSIISRDSPSLVSRELRDIVSTSQSFLNSHERNIDTLGPSQAGPQGGSSPPPPLTLLDHQETNGPQRPSGLDGRVADRALKQLAMCPKDTALHVTFTDETANIQEKCI